MPDTQGLQATDHTGAVGVIYRCETTWGWRYVNPACRGYAYGWALSESEARREVQRSLKPDTNGEMPKFRERGED